MGIDQEKSPKKQEVVARRVEVDRLHIWGYSIAEIAEKLKVDSRTIDRDIQENRREWLKALVYEDARKWLKDQLADYIAFMNQSKRTFCQQAESFKNESAKSRALWYAVQIENQKVETIKSLVFSLDDIKAGGMSLNEDYDDDDV